MRVEPSRDGSPRGHDACPYPLRSVPAEKTMARPQLQAPPSTSAGPPRPWWMVAIAFVVVVALLFGAMLALRLCGGSDERPRITPVIPFRP